jgi:hypothetical protein
MVALHPLIDHKTSQCSHRRGWPVEVSKSSRPLRLGQSHVNQDGTATVEVVPWMVVREGASDLEQKEVKWRGWSGVAARQTW